MNIEIKAVHFTLRDETKDFINKKSNASTTPRT